jgi:hypothetical protein
LSVIKEFWIFTKTGDPLVHFDQSQENPEIYDYEGSIWKESQILPFQQIIEENFKKKKFKKDILNLNNSFFHFAQCLDNETVIFYKTNEEIKEKRMKKLCKKISRIFEDSYSPSQLEFAEENPDIFKKFRTKLNLFFKLSKL